MGLKNGGYATIWSVEDKGNFSNVRLSTSKKAKGSDTYEQDFGGFVRFVGEAHKAASSLKEKDRIKLGEIEVTNSYNAEKKVTYTNVAAFSFEMVDGSKPASSSAKPASIASKSTPKVDEPVNDEDPF